MATAAATPGNRANFATSVPGRRYDNLFFSAMALLILATVFLGFARTYYLAGMIRAPLPAFIIHLHGAVFSCWILLLVTQTALVSAGRVDIHRRLGLVVDHLIGQQDIVIKPLGASLSGVRGFSGATELGNQRVGLLQVRARR